MPVPARFVLAFLLYTGTTLCADSPTLDYGRDVRPILSENCFHCHGQDSKKRMAGLRIDTAEGATASRNGRAALVPGDVEASVIHQRITTDNKARRMPPVHSNRTLTADQIATIDRWIREGGHYTKHWAFVPPQLPALPSPTDQTWAKQPLDRFVLQRLEAEGLKPAHGAPPETWFRRVSLDLTGLPPSPADTDAFTAAVRKRGEAAYASAVDRLLASPAYGERMAMDWLDVARYADTHGFNNDAERSMWRWRDWVIESFNSNLPYDRFITEQLAGDLLPKPTLDQRIATGFGRNHVINSEGGIIDEEYRVEYVADRVRTLGMAWLGLTLECARCHDHKFDPVTQRDHYRFYAFFNSVPEMGEDGRVSNAVPMIPAPTREQQIELTALERKLNPGHPRIDHVDPHWPDDAALRVKEMTGEKPLADPVALSKRTPFTIAVSITPTAADSDVPLLSAVDYSPNPASTTHGKGTELRLAGGELEFRLSDRFPAYSVRVRSEGAAIQAGQTRHVAVVYSGPAPDDDAMRVYAKWIRIFIDGRELATQVINEGAMLSSKTEKPSNTRFRIGWDNRAKTTPFNGQFLNAAIWTRALTDNELTAAFGTKPDPVRSKYLALRRSLPTVMVMEELPVPRETHILLRGAYNAPGDKVDAGVPEELLGSWPEGAPKNRLGLARWLTKPDHPLTARVVVNRFWQQLFGQGIVKTSDNFGLQGDSPSHPELLDWLAREFIDSGWNGKALLKQIVLSATYRQDSTVTPELLARDPENRLLARGPRFRLPGELIRDQALAIAGLLKPHVGGPSVFPYQKEDLYKGIVVAADYPGTKWVESKGDDLYRRSMYTFWKRTLPHPTMTVFDAPDREVCTVRRSTTNTPLQALTLLNDPIFLEAARKLAERAIKEGGTTASSRLAFAFRLATGRTADDNEQQILRAKLDQMLTLYRADDKSAREFLKVGASPADASIPPAELAAYAAVANIILNLDEVITKA